MNLRIDPLGNPLTTLPRQMGWEVTIEQYPSWLFESIDNTDCLFSNGSVWTPTRTWSDVPEPSLTLGIAVAGLPKQVERITGIFTVPGHWPRRLPNGVPKDQKTIAEWHTELNAKPRYQRPTKWPARSKGMYYQSCLPRWRDLQMQCTKRLSEELTRAPIMMSMTTQCDA